MERKYDLIERAGKFGKDVIIYCKGINRNAITIPLISQLVRSSTSIGANYCEADCAQSRKDFEHKVAISRKEARETRHWLEMMIAAEEINLDENSRLQKEATELYLILNAIIKKSKENS